MLQGQLDLLNALSTQLNVSDYNDRCTTVLANLMETMARTPNLAPQQATRCIQLVAGSQLNGNQRTTLIDGITALSTGQGTQRNGRNCDILNIHHYLPNYVWDVIEGQNSGYPAKLKVVEELLEKMGLMSPNELSYVHLAALLFTASRINMSVVSYDSSMMVVNDLKVMMRTRRSRSPRTSGAQLFKIRYLLDPTRGTEGDE